MAKKSDWRRYANAIIVKIIRDNMGLEEKELRKKISDAYPWGERAMHPYKIWCSEVASCLYKLRGFGTNNAPAGGDVKEQMKLF